MKPSERIKQIENLLLDYTTSVNRGGMPDLAIWQSLKMYYTYPEDSSIEPTSTMEEAFERMIADKWVIYMGQHFFGLDYETTDEAVLKYLKENKLVKDISEEEDDVD